MFKQDVLSHNLFGYCGNEPVNQFDFTGFSANTVSKIQKIQVNTILSNYRLANYKFKYMRNKAIEYASLWHWRRNPLYYSYTKDCANFVSQCLYAGGIPMVNNIIGGWYSYRVVQSLQRNRSGIVVIKKYSWNISPAWRLADKQYNTIKKSKLSNKTFSITSKADIKKKLKKYTVKKGDLLYFDYENDKKMNHATIISSVSKSSIKYSAHTSSRFDRDVKSAFDDYSKLRLYVVTIKDSWISRGWL